MANPYLPDWDVTQDGEPRVFGDRIYVYGSHDKAGSTRFCDHVLKCWSASTDNLSIGPVTETSFIQRMTGIIWQMQTGQAKNMNCMHRML